MNLKKNKYIYITDSYSNTVTDSQVINKIKVLEKEGIIFNLYIFSPIHSILRNLKENKKNLKYARKNITGRVIQIPILKSNDQTGISSLIKILSFIILLFNQKNQIIVQTRSLRDYLSLKIIRKISTNIKILFDFRGAVAEEYINGKGFNSIDEVDNIHIINKYDKLVSQQSLMFELSDKVFCVSNKMKEYVCRNNIDSSKIIVIPGAADLDDFNFDEFIRDEYRGKLNFSPTDKVVVYSGRLDSFYCVKEQVFKLIYNLFKLDINYKFLCLTTDLDTAHKLIEKYNINKKRCILKHVRYDVVSHYLNAADYGLLIRKNIKTNFVASPTKVSEYLLCGLPVLISKNVGDFSEYIVKNKFGIIINEDPIESARLVQDNILLKKLDRSKISLKSKDIFSKQAYNYQLKNLYERM